MGKKESRLSPVVFLRGKQICLRPLDESDLPWLLRWANDREVSEFFSRHRPTTAVMEKKWLEKILADKGSDVRLGIMLAREYELIGTVSLHRVDLVHGTAWVGIAIGRKDCWSKGYGFEAIMLLLDYGFNQLNLRKVCWGAFDSNERSIGCAQKCGFREEGRMKAQFRRGDQFLDDLSFGVFRDDWLLLWKKYQQNQLK